VVIFLVAIVGLLVRPMVVRSGAVVATPLRAAHSSNGFQSTDSLDLMSRVGAASDAVKRPPSSQPQMMDVDQAAKGMKDAETEAEIEDFIEGFRQPTSAPCGSMASGSPPGHPEMGGLGIRGLMRSGSNSHRFLRYGSRLTRPF
jgi:hypothetical protein